MTRDIVFCNLEAELLRAKLTKAELATMIGISYGSIRAKFTGKTDFNLKEMMIIKEKLEILDAQDFTLDYLFKRN